MESKGTTNDATKADTPDLLSPLSVTTETPSSETKYRREQGYHNQVAAKAVGKRGSSDLKNQREYGYSLSHSQQPLTS